MTPSLMTLLRRLRAVRWLALASFGMMLTCGTNTGTGNAAPAPADVAAAIAVRR